MPAAAWRAATRPHSGSLGSVNHASEAVVREPASTSSGKQVGEGLWMVWLRPLKPMTRLFKRVVTSERSKCAEHLVVLPLSGQLVFAETLISGVPQRANRMKLLLPPPLTQRRQGLGQSIIGKGVLRIRDLVARCLRIGRLLRFLDRDHRGSRSREEKRGRIIGSLCRASHPSSWSNDFCISDILGRPVGGNFRWTAR